MWRDGIGAHPRTRSGIRPTGMGDPYRPEATKGSTMTISSTTLPLVHTMGRSLRILLVTAAILVLATVAFILGRVTVNSSSTPAKVPAVVAHVPASNEPGICQQVGHFRSAGC
jgi:hypothetical protein